ncbi:MAG: phosphate acyltransferase PlsX [Bdellovibrionota bacterium]
MTVYIDAMGGDRAPESVLAGVQLVARDAKVELVLLGDESVLNPLLKHFRGARPRVVHCPDTISMSESPVQAVRSKKGSSIVQGLRLAAETPRSAFFSAGHSGAVFAAALMTMGRIEGVERPAIATALPTLEGHCILLDAGANVDCRPSHLVEFARMGSVYAKVYLRHENPSIGLLSNGEEESKGTELTRAAHELLKSEPNMNYLGYVEGKEIFSTVQRELPRKFRGPLDVVVTDGFTGNIVLKSLEGLGRTVSNMIKSELGRSPLTKMGALFSLPALKKVQKRLDYAEVGSAPLLGVDGNCFIGHGRSSPKAIKNGILRAQEAIELGLHEALRAKFQQAST